MRYVTVDHAKRDLWVETEADFVVLTTSSNSGHNGVYTNAVLTPAMCIALAERLLKAARKAEGWDGR